MTSRSPFLHVEGQRLFRVDVFACLAGVNARQHPLELARGHDDRIKIVPLQQLAVVLIDGPLAALLRLERLGPGEVAVGQCDELAILGELLQQERGPVPDPDPADRNPLVGPRLALACEDLPGNHERNPKHPDGLRLRIADASIGSSSQVIPR